MGRARAPVVGSGLVPAWICRVSKLQLCGSVMRRLLSSGEPAARGGLRPCGTTGAVRPALPLEHLRRSRGCRAASQVLVAASREPETILEASMSHVKHASQQVDAASVAT